MPISLPEITLNILSATTSVENQAQKVLFVGQKTSAGSATPGALYANILNDQSWNGLFGENSMLAAMLRSARALNQVTEFDAIPLADDGGASPALGTVLFTGPASDNGTITVNIGSSVNHSYILNITDTETATAIGAALTAAITADLTCPVTAVNTTGSVALTAVNYGLEGNTISIEILGSVPGVGVTLTAMTGGATNPDLTTLFDVITNTRYQTIVFPNTYSSTVLIDYLDGLFNVDNAIMDGVGIQSDTDTYSNILSTVTALNSQSYVLLANNSIVGNALYSGSSLLELGYVISSEFAALRSLRLTAGANISGIVTASVSSADTIGGPAIASLPYFNTPFANLPLIGNGNEFSQVEIDSLNSEGASILSNNLSLTSIIAGNIVTTYKFDSASNPDVSFKYLEYVDTISNIREYYFNNLKARFSQCRLTTGDLQPGRTMANQQLIEAYCTQLYVDLAGPDFVLTVAGEAALVYYKNNLQITLNLSTGLVTIYMVTPIVTQLRQIIGTIKLSFNTNG
jgi:phage tail sheath gpL-like